MSCLAPFQVIVDHLSNFYFQQGVGYLSLTQLFGWNSRTGNLASRN